MIPEIRAALIADLKPVKVQVYSGWPDRPVPPCLVVGPAQGATYVEGGQNFGEYTIRMEVLALVARGKDDEALTKLDQLIEAVLANTVDWGLEGVETPTLVVVGQQPVLGTLISLAKSARL